MNKFIYNLLIVLLTITILNYAFDKKSHQESFEMPGMPKIIGEYYRPLERNIRITYEGFYDKSSKKFSNLFRKFGII